MEKAKVTVEYGETINTGDYNSVRVTAKIEYPCNPTKADVETTFHRLWRECKKEIQKQKEEVNEG